jgi:uncharacterized protein (DUF2126 family)/transglutaminase-like putative cysteine protease
MSIQVALQHTTRYSYDRLVNLGPQVIRLRPAAHARTPVLGYSLKIGPEEHFLNWQQDPHGNFLARAVFPKPVREFEVSVDLVLDLVVFNPFDFFVEDSVEHWPFRYADSLTEDLAPCLKTHASTPLLEAFLAKVPRERKRSVDFMVEVNRMVSQEIAYLVRMEPGVQTPEETLQKKSGSCRDSAWLLVQILRRLGIAARFASGYLVQLAPDRKELDGPSGPEKDFTDLHAWAEAYLPGAGWIGLDPTSGLLAGEGHVPLACSPEPGSAAPISGGVEKSEVEFSFSMSVTRLPEAPRSTRPYSEEEWRAIDQAGRLVDQRLREGDVRLTMGGEPTFVSIDDRDGDEWNTTAMGPNKRKLAGKLLKRLRDRFAPGGMIHHGQGKQYPGESLPRWALSCHWRRDHQAIWTDPSLWADEEKPDYNSGADAARFLSHLAARLDVDPAYSMPGYEDAWYWMWKERRLPTNVDPHKSNLEDPEERARIARVFDRGLQDVIGYALPLRRGDGGWESGNWFLRRERLYLIPGDSPMGYRLPLDSLPWAVQGDLWADPERDPLQPLGALPPRMQKRAQSTTGQEDRLRDSMDPADLVRTALCAEVRDGVLRLFLPPLSKAEHWIELVAAIEETAKTTGLRILTEGYGPARDPRLNSFAVTPDPGVIEVNVHPAHDWSEAVHISSVLYEEARNCRLDTQKFLVDGRLAGTGGGNHVVVGGSTPGDSPFLRRPDLLRSMLGYWIAHPSLSYAFSGLFTGPTSQSPRVDEARNDAVHELDLAFRQIPDNGNCPPWLVDRVLRNLLVDATGNTHRTEFCIDKMYSPDSSAGRLGLLELRSFEMPPHERMSLAQQLLVRALVARFWEDPWKKPVARWNNILHDRWMLPRFLQDDLGEVLGDLREHGIPMEDSWFRPHMEFRFPEVGSFDHAGTQVKIRHALEPWHVLGEEPGGGGAVRYVDSSLERLEVLVTTATPDRHQVLCNGAKMPLNPTGIEGEYVAGVRFRAWWPPSCLHPTIGVHSPLVFDLHDTWAERNLTGATYHVMHPGGRAYETRPVNGNEAESRRHERFQRFGHGQGRFRPVECPPRPEAPLTLDLRWM